MRADGGPAFPRRGVRLIMPQSLAGHPDVQKIEYEQDGLSLRDYFAAKAMQAIIANPEQRATSLNRKCTSENGRGEITTHDETIADIVAQNAYFMADAMLAERARE